jgi:hypothetical protein
MFARKRQSSGVASLLMASEPPAGSRRSLRPRDSAVLFESEGIIVWRASHRAVVEFTKDGKHRVATFWVDEEDGFPQLAHSVHPADDPDLDRRWAKIISEGNARLEAGLKRLRERR